MKQNEQYIYNRRLTEGGVKGCSKIYNSKVEVSIIEDAFTNKYVVVITRIGNDVTKMYRLGDFLNKGTSVHNKIETELIDYFALKRNEFVHLQQEVNNLLDKIDLIETVFIPNELDTLAESLYAELLQCLNDNLDKFATRQLLDSQSNMPKYIEGESWGVYIADDKGLEKYGCEAIAILPSYLKGIVKISDNLKLHEILQIWVKKGYLYGGKDRLDATISFGKGIKPRKHAYVFFSPSVNLEDM